MENGQQIRPFRRGLNQEVEEAAKPFFNSGIGKKIVEAKKSGRPVFQVCIRDNYLNVYWRGCSVLKYKPLQGKFTIHHKYVETNKPQGNNVHYVPLANSDDDLRFGDWSFSQQILEPACGGHIRCLEQYSDPQVEKRSLAAFIEQEKPLLVDLEVAFTRICDRTDKQVADRIDMAELVMQGNSPMLRMVEVKLASDPRLRSESKPKIMTQMGCYKGFIGSQKPEILESYRTVAENYLALGITELEKEMLKRFIECPELDPEPHLLVLGTREELQGRKGCHWTNLLDLFREAGYPEPRLHSI